MVTPVDVTETSAELSAEAPAGTETSHDGADRRTAIAEAQLRSLLSTALRKGRLESLRCKHEARAGRDFPWVLALVFLFLTAGFFFASLLGLQWWWSIVGALLAAAVFLGAFYAVVLIPDSAERTQLVAVWALLVIAVLFVPVTAIVQGYLSGWRAVGVTHVLPLLLVLPIYVAALWAAVLRLLRFVRYLPALLLATVGVLLIPLFTQELWELAAKTDLVRGLALMAALALGILVLTLLAWRQMLQQDPLRGAANRLAMNPDEALDEALHFLRSKVGYADKEGILGRRVLQVPQSGVAHVGQTVWDRPQDLTAGPTKPTDLHPHVREVLRSSFAGERLEKYIKDSVRDHAKDLFGGRLLLLRLLVLVLLLTLFGFLIFYVVAMALVSIDVAERWSQSRAGTIPHGELLAWLGIETSFPLGPYLWLPLTFALVATAVSLTFIVTNEARRAGLTRSLGDEIRLALLIGAPYYRLPTNDTFACALAITGFHSTIGCDNYPNQGSETDEPAHAGGHGGRSVWYRWTAPASGLVVMRAAGKDFEKDELEEDFETALAVYTGSSLATLSEVGSDAGQPSAVRFEAKKCVEYRIAVDAVEGNIGSIDLELSLAEPLTSANGTMPGRIGEASCWWWRAPADARVVFDATGSNFDARLAVDTVTSYSLLSLEASDDDALYHQGPFPLNVQADDEYLIVVRGHGGSTGDVVLKWAANGAFAAAADLEGASGQIEGWNAPATQEPSELELGGARVWYRWTAPSDASVTFDAASSDFDALLAVYTGGSVDSLALVAQSDQGAAGETSSRTSFRADAGMTYAIAVDARDGATGDFSLRWAANDAFGDRAELNGATGRTAGWNGAATAESGEPEHGADAGQMSVWYRWIAPGAGEAIFTAGIEEFDPVVAVYTGASLPVLDRVSMGEEMSSSASFAAEAGETYSIGVDGRRGESGDVEFGSFDLHWELPPSNVHFASAIELEGESRSITSWNVRAAREPKEPDHAGNAGGASVWFRWTAPVDGRAVFDTSGSSFDTLLAVYAGASLDDLVSVAANDDVPGASWSQVSFEAVAGEVYSIAVDGYDGATGDIALAWELEPPPALDRVAAPAQLRPANRRP